MCNFHWVCISFRRCTCGNCNQSLLVSAREYRCCNEILQATGKFTFEGLPVSCIITHEDYPHLTHKSVLHLVGPMLTGKDGKYYKQRHGNRENEWVVYYCQCHPRYFSTNQMTSPWKIKFLFLKYVFQYAGYILIWALSCQHLSLFTDTLVAK